MLIRKESFCLWIETFRRENKESYINSVLEACTKFHVEEGLVKDLLNVQIINKLEAEAMKLNILKKTAKPIRIQ